MNKSRWLVVVLLVVAAGTWMITKLQKQKPEPESSPAASAQVATYWTCPMHPFIHQSHPGECPICHMKLVEVKAEPAQQGHQDEAPARSEVQVSSEQLNLIGVQRHEVEKMSLQVSIPVSGRFISPTGVAFQIYENDRRYVRPGLRFRGESSFYPEQEITGVISSVDSIVDPTSRTVRVIGSVEKGAQGNASETGFRGEIIFELNDRVAIPESSVLHAGQGDLVYVFTEANKLSARPVKLGLKSEGFYDVLSGLKAGETISSGPNFLIDSEAKIRGAGAVHDHSNH